MKTCKCGKEFEPVQHHNSHIRQSKCFECLTKKGAKMEHKRLKELKKDKGWYEKKIEIEVNEICRIIDYGQNCISCSCEGNQAGHRHSVGSNPSIRYNLHNLHLQETSCNSSKAGNHTKYDEGLLRIYGEKYRNYVAMEIVALYPYLGLSVPELKEVLERARIAKKKLLMIKKVNDPIERLKLRDYANQEIGIYKHKFLN